MKNRIYILLSLILISCNSGNKEETSIELGRNKESETLPSCNCDSLIKNPNNELLFGGEIFTGFCFSNYPSSEQKYIEKQILDGLVHGKITYFGKTGKILFDESYSYGELLTSTENESRCNCKNLKIKESSDKQKKNYLNESLFTGTCQDFYPNTNQIYLEANYKKGILHGFTIYYNKDGSVLMMQSYEEGTLIKDIIPQ